MKNHINIACKAIIDSNVYTELSVLSILFFVRTVNFFAYVFNPYPGVFATHP